MRVPAAAGSAVDLDEPHTPFDESAGHQTIGSIYGSPGYPSHTTSWLLRSRSRGRPRRMRRRLHLVRELRTSGPRVELESSDLSPPRCSLIFFATPIWLRCCSSFTPTGCFKSKIGVSPVRNSVPWKSAGRNPECSSATPPRISRSSERTMKVGRFCGARPTRKSPTRPWTDVRRGSSRCSSGTPLPRGSDRPPSRSG